MDVRYDTVIIGSGIGGLTLAALLSKEGYKVALIEKNKYVGGNMSTFMRQGITFDTGIHYTGGFDKGGMFDLLYKYLGIRDKIHVQRQSIESFDKISYQGQIYDFAQGYDRHLDTLSSYFPKYRKEIKSYLDEVKQYGNLDSLNSRFSKTVNLSTLGINAYDKIRSIIKDDYVFNVLTGTNALYAGVRSKTPFVLHAHVMDAYISDSWKFVGGGQHVADAMADVITDHGGTVFLGQKAERFEYTDKLIDHVVLESGEKIFAKKVVSTIHPSLTLKMVPENKMRKTYTSRIMGIENTMSMFSLFLVMKENTMPYMNYNYYHHNEKDTWISDYYDPKRWPHGFFLFSQLNQPNQQYEDGIVAMAHMSYDEVKQWSGLPINRRGEAYEAFKELKTEQMLQNIEKAMPGFRSKIKACYSSTPVSYESYYNMPEGAAYGIQRDCTDPLGKTILPATKTPNLYLGGQSVSLHGLFGVAVGSLILASAFTGGNALIEKIYNQ
jgi:all-trans-retinol 13,14-reductase